MTRLKTGWGVKHPKFVRGLTELFKKNTKFVWGDKQKQAFDEAKKEIVKDNVLVHYSQETPLVLCTDASDVGIGGILSHEYGNDKPIAFYSSALTQTEKNYAVIDKEALEIVTSIKKFHQFLEGRHFTIYTDHKPLIYLFNKKDQIKETSPRRLRWILYVISFDYEIRHKKGVDNSNVDALSRMPLQAIDQSQCINDNAQFLNIIDNALILKDDLKEEYLTGESMVLLRKLVQNPTNLNKNKIIFKEYSPYMKSLAVVDDFIFYGERILIPINSRKKVFMTLHICHIGIAKTKALA